jgi:Holliday junction resolvasome RuvABC ATP-dependent DNA helicase subunit
LFLQQPKNNLAKSGADRVAENFYQETVQSPKSAFDLSLRPPLFSEFQGQTRVRERLELRVTAAKQREDVLEHVLLSGPPGLGKTTLAFILANAMGVNIKSTSGPMIEKAGDLAGLLTTLERGDILFIDEIHRLQPAIEEYLYPAMEDFRLDIIIDQGPNARSNLLRWVRDFAQVKGDGFIDQATADRALQMLDIDDDGLDEMDKRLLEALVSRFQGGPVGISSLAVAVGEDSGTIEEVNEPYLIQEGYLQRTAQGRVALPKTYQKLGVKLPSGRQSELF